MIRAQGAAIAIACGFLFSLLAGCASETVYNGTSVEQSNGRLYVGGVAANGDATIESATDNQVREDVTVRLNRDDGDTVTLVFDGCVLQFVMSQGDNNGQIEANQTCDFQAMERDLNFAMEGSVSTDSDAIVLNLTGTYIADTDEVPEGDFVQRTIQFTGIRQ